MMHVSKANVDQIEGYAQGECFIGCWESNSVCVENTQKTNG